MGNCLQYLDTTCVHNLFPAICIFCHWVLQAEHAPISERIWKSNSKEIYDRWFSLSVLKSTKASMSVCCRFDQVICIAEQRSGGIKIYQCYSSSRDEIPDYSEFHLFHALFSSWNHTKHPIIQLESKVHISRSSLSLLNLIPSSKPLQTSRLSDEYRNYINVRNGSMRET